MSWVRRLLPRRRPGPGLIEVHIGDPAFDEWDVVRDFSELRAARAWCQHLQDAGIEAVLASDWPLDRFGRGDIALRVPPGSWSDAEEILGGFDDDE